MQHLNFNFNIALNTINCINDIDYTYHIIRNDYPSLHSHDDYYEFSIVLDGEILNVNNGKKELITKKTLFISDSKDCHFLKKTKGNINIKILNIIARHSAIKEVLNFLFPKDFKEFLKVNKVFHLSDDIIHLIEQSITTINSLSATDWELTNSLLKSTITTLLNYLFVKSIDHNQVESVKYKKLIEKLNDLKSSGRLFSLGVNDLCYEFGYSRTHLNRIFYEIFNVSPFEYLLKCKMEYAASLLLYTDYSIKEISEMVGYSSTLRFAHNFKEIYNLSPFEYRKK